MILCIVGSEICNSITDLNSRIMVLWSVKHRAWMTSPVSAAAGWGFEEHIELGT